MGNEAGDSSKNFTYIWIDKGELEFKVGFGRRCGFKTPIRTTPPRGNCRGSRDFNYARK